MFKFILAVYFMCIGIALFSQSANTLIGARAQSLGHASSCLYDEWAIFNNVAGLANTKTTTAGFTYEAFPSFKYFNQTAFVAAIPFKFGAFGFGALRFGDPLYNEHLLSGGVASTFGLASLGLKVNYIQYHAEGSGNRSLISVSFGGIAKLTNELSVGAHIININQGKITDDGRERLPTILQAGISFSPFEKLIVVTEVQKDLDHDALWKSGVEYQPFKKFTFRTGFNVHPSAAFAGIRGSFYRMHADYAITFLSPLGMSHQATVSYQFQKQKI